MDQHLQHHPNPADHPECKACEMWLKVVTRQDTVSFEAHTSPPLLPARYWNSAESDDRKEVVEDMKAELQKQEPLSVRW